MKKIIIILALFFVWILEINAISYNWSSIESMPQVSSWGTNLFFKSPRNVGLSQPTFIKDVWVWKLVSFDSVHIFPANTSFSWLVTSYYFRNPANTNIYSLEIRSTSWSTSDTLSYVLRNYDTTLPDEWLVQTGVIAIRSKDSCPWLTWNCAISIHPNFMYLTEVIWVYSLYIQYVDFIYYFNTWSQTINHRLYFWDLLNSWETPNFQKTFGNFYSGNTDLWVKIWTLFTSSPQMFIWQPDTILSSYWYNPSIDLEIYDQKLNDFFIWNTGSFLDYYMPQWFWWTSSSGATDNIIIPPINNWTWWLSDGWYDSCNWIVSDFWCYVTATINNTIGNFFPEISFDWSFQSCDFALVNASGWYMQRFANVISVINPIPPDEWAPICMYFSWTGTMGYQRIIPEENFFEHYVPWALPQVEWIDITPLWQSIFDIFVIFGITVLIFHRKNHD